MSPCRALEPSFPSIGAGAGCSPMVPVMYPTSPSLALVLGTLVPLLASGPLAAQPREQLATVPPPVVVVVPVVPGAPVVPATPVQVVPVAPAVLPEAPTVPVAGQPVAARQRTA